MPGNYNIQKIVFVFIFLSTWFIQNAVSQSEYINRFIKVYQSSRNQYFIKSLSGNSYDFMVISTALDALQSIYTTTKDSAYLNDEKKIIDNIISSSGASFALPGNINKIKDDYLGWISKTRHQAYNNEAQLFESYVFQYIVKFLYQLKRSGWVSLSPEHAQWYNNTLFFTEKHIWRKWIDRSTRQSGLPYRIFLGIRTHMAAHWAGIALVLEQLTQNEEIKNQCRELYTEYDTLLKRNLKPNPVHPDAYTWNCTWDNIDKTQARKDSRTIIQDVSHGNHVISYIITAQEMGNSNWSIENINKFINTVKLVVYDSQNHIFSDGVDGSPSLTRPGWGNFQADGWVKLGRFDKDLQYLYINYSKKRKNLLLKYSQSLQYYANLALNEYYIQSLN